MEDIKKYLKENYVSKKEIKKIIAEIWKEFSNIDERIIYKLGQDEKVYLMQELSWIAGMLEELIGDE